MTDVVANEKLPRTFVKNDDGTWSCENGPSNAVSYYAKKLRKVKTVGELIELIKKDAADRDLPEPVNVEAFVNGMREAQREARGGQQQAAPVAIIVRSLHPINEADLKPHDWLIKNMLLRGQVSHYFGPGGTAKSLFSLAIATAC